MTHPYRTPGRVTRMDPATLKPGECSHCGHDVDAHFEKKHACTLYRCDCKKFQNPDGSVHAVDEGFCDCSHLIVDHSAVGCHWCICKRERR